MMPPPLNFQGYFLLVLSALRSGTIQLGCIASGSILYLWGIKISGANTSPC